MAPCSATFSAPVGANQTIKALLFASANGSGSALAVGSGTSSIFASQATTVNFSLSGIMSTFSVSLNPSTVTVGQTTPIQITENALDAAGEALAAGFVNTSLSSPAFSVSVSDSTGLSSAAAYSGVGSGPIAYSVQTPNYPAATASLAFTSAAPVTVGYVLDSYVPPSPSSTCDVRVYATGASTPARHYILLCAGHPRLDPNDTLWGIAPIGINPDGTSAGAFEPPGTLLTFDTSGKAYVADHATNAVDVYSGSTLLRQINLTAAPTGAAVDPVGNVYIGVGGSGINEYPSSETGNVSPIAFNATANGVPATDGAGNVYALYGSTLGIWPSGNFSSNPPLRTLSLSFNAYGSLADFGVDPAGDIYAVPPAPFDDSAAIYYASAGSSAFAQLPGSSTANFVALPIK